MNKAITLGLAALAACSLCACLGGGAVIDYSEAPPKADKTGSEPSLWSDDKGTTDTPRTADDREELANANGATAKTISFNHPEPHALVISGVDLTEGRGGVFTLSEGGGAFGQTHTHDVSLNREQMAQLRDGAEISVETTVGGTNGGHTHVVTISRR